MEEHALLRYTNGGMHTVWFGSAGRALSVRSCHMDVLGLVRRQIVYAGLRIRKVDCSTEGARLLAGGCSCSVVGVPDTAIMVSVRSLGRHRVPLCAAARIDNMT
jgi:hypothetical protein